VCNILKRNPRLRQIPLVLTSKTAKPETFEQHKRLATRADFYLTPPIAADRIIEELRADLREPRGELVKRLMAIEAKEPSVERGAGGLFAIGVALLIALGMAAAIFFSQ
jgi:CheY-like chemotaxis protein